MSKYFEAMYQIYKDAKSAYYRYLSLGFSDAKQKAYSDMVQQYWGISTMACYDMDLKVGEFTEITNQREKWIDKFYKEF